MVQYSNQILTFIPSADLTQISLISPVCDNLDLKARGPTQENKPQLLGLALDLTTSTKVTIKQSIWSMY